MFAEDTHLCSRRGNNQPEQTIFFSTAASLSCPESTKQHKHWWENTLPPAAQDIWWGKTALQTDFQKADRSNSLCQYRLTSS